MANTAAPSVSLYLVTRSTYSQLKGLRSKWWQCQSHALLLQTTDAASCVVCCHTHLPCGSSHCRKTKSNMQLSADTANPWRSSREAGITLSCLSCNHFAAAGVRFSSPSMTGVLPAAATVVMMVLGVGGRLVVGGAESQITTVWVWLGGLAADSPMRQVIQVLILPAVVSDLPSVPPSLIVAVQSIGVGLNSSCCDL